MWSRGNARMMGGGRGWVVGCDRDWMRAEIWGGRGEGVSVDGS